MYFALRKNQLTLAYSTPLLEHVNACLRSEYSYTECILEVPDV